MQDLPNIPTVVNPDMTEVLSGVNLRQAEEAVELTREMSTQVTSIRLQLLAVQVLGGLGRLPLLPRGDVYVLSAVVDDIEEASITCDGLGYGGIKEGDLLPLGSGNDPSAVYNVYLREHRLPRNLSFCLLVARSNKGLRDIGAAISQVMSDDRLGKLKMAMKAGALVVSPEHAAVLEVADRAIQILATHLAIKPDDKLGYYRVGYTNAFDNLGVGRHPPDTRTIEIDKIRFAYQIDAR